MRRRHRLDGEAFQPGAGHITERAAEPGYGSNVLSEDMIVVAAAERHDVFKQPVTLKDLGGHACVLQPPGCRPAAADAPVETVGHTIRRCNGLNAGAWQNKEVSMLALQFRGDSIERQRDGAAWICSSGLVVTCMHCVSFDGKRWAVDDEHGAGEYALLDDDRVVDLLDPVLSIPSLDVALLRFRSTESDNRLHTLDTSLDWLAQGSSWYADARPRQFDGQEIRLSGTLARWGAHAQQSHQLIVLQGTDVDWASVSGSPVLHDQRVVGMLRQQLDAGNTCLAINAYAIELALWVAHGLHELSALRPIDPVADDFGYRPREIDRLAELLIAEGATPQDLEPLFQSRPDGAVTKTLDALFRDRPLPTADSAEQDLCRRSLGALRSGARTTSDGLLRIVFSAEDVSSKVFVAPRFLRVETRAPQSPPAPGKSDGDKKAAREPSISYQQLLASLTGFKSNELHRIAVLGEAGSGKSTLLTHLAQEILEHGWGLAIGFHFQQLRATGLLQAIEERWLPEMRITASKELYLQAIQRLSRVGKLWIFIDGIDEVGLTHREPLEQIARSLVGTLESAHVIVASRHAYWYHGTNDLYGFSVYDIEALTPDRVFHFIGQWFIAEPSVSAALAGELSRPGRAYLLNAVRNPLRLAMLCALWSRRSRLGVDHPLPTTRSALYEQFLDLIYDWNLRRATVGSVDRDELMAALSRLALHVLSHPSADDPERAGSFGDDAVSESNPGVAADVRAALVEIGWVVRDRTIAQTRRRLRFAHRTWLEYFAARGLSKGTDLLNLESAGGPTRFLESSWREVVLFWMGRDTVPVDDKRRLLLEVVAFRDRMWGVYSTRALHLVPACLKECDCFSEVQTYRLVEQIMRQAVGRKDEGGQYWLVGFPAFEAAARAALVDADPSAVALTAWSAAIEADGMSKTPKAFWQAMASTLSLAAGTNADSGRLAAQILLDPWARRRIRVQAAPLLRNPVFVKALMKAARSGGGQGEQALELLAGAATDSPEAADIAYRLLRDRKAWGPDAEQALLRVLRNARRSSPAMLRFLERSAFSPGTADRELWLQTLSALTSRHAALARRLWAELPDPSRPSVARTLAMKTLASLDDVPDRIVEQVLAARASWIDSEPRWSGLDILRKAASKRPRLLRIIFDELRHDMHERWVADALSPLERWQVDATIRARLVDMLRSRHPSTRFEAARITLAQRDATEADRGAALDVLDELVEQFSDPSARLLETPWRAARLLRDLGVRRPQLVERVMATIRSTADDDARRAGMGVLGDIGQGLTPAAQLLMDILERHPADPSLSFAALRELEKLGLPSPKDRSRLLKIGWALRDSDLIRWLLDCLSAWQIDEPAAARLAEHVIANPDADELRVESAVNTMHAVAAFRERGVTALLKMLDSPDAKRRRAGLRFLKQLAAPSRRVTEALLLALEVESVEANIDWIEQALDVQVAAKAEGALAIPAFKRLMNQSDETPGSRERQRVANELLLQIASRTPYLEFKAIWNAEEELS